MLGSSSSVTGTVVLGLPASSSVLGARALLGRALLYDASASAVRAFHASRWAGTTISITSESGTVAGASVPWTWGASDTITVEGSYRAS